MRCLRHCLLLSLSLVSLMAILAHAAPHAQPEHPHAQPEHPHAQPEHPHAQPEHPHAQPEHPHVKQEQLPSAEVDINTWGMPLDLSMGFLALSQGRYPDAVAIFQTLHLQPNPMATAMLEYCRIHGLGLRQDTERALTTLQKLSQATPKSLAAYIYLSSQKYYCPNPKESQAAISYLTEQSAQGNIPLRYMLADAYCSGILIEEDPPRCIDLLTQAATAGYAPAQFDLGERYEAGYGVLQDVSQGQHWIQKATRQGFSLILHRD